MSTAQAPPCNLAPEPCVTTWHNGYDLLPQGTSGPIPTKEPPAVSTSTVFCPFSPTPSGSWNGITKDPASAILWAVENPNKDNHGQPNPDCKNIQDTHNAALHAFSAVPNANGVLTEIYGSRLVQTPAGDPPHFPVPTIFNGQVYVGTNTYVNGAPGVNGLVDVFGLCSNGPQGHCQP